jgi:hypothetical protein
VFTDSTVTDPKDIPFGEPGSQSESAPATKNP